jgi:hypothetical protein
MNKFEIDNNIINLNKVTSFSKDVNYKIIYDEETLNKTVIYYFKIKLGSDKYIFRRSITINHFISKMIKFWKFKFNIKQVNPEWKKFNSSKILLEQIKEKDNSSFVKYFAIKTNTFDLYNEVNQFKKDFVKAL